MGNKSKKNPFRKITVDGTIYRWKVIGEDGYIRVLIGPNAKKGQFAEGGFPYFSLEIERFGPEGKAIGWGVAQRLVLTPHHIRHTILYALKKGWKADEPGPTFSLGKLDDQMELRLKPSLEFPTLSDGQVVLTFAAAGRGTPLQPNFAPFTGEGKFYLTFPNLTAAIEFAREKVQENPETECWIRREKNVADYYVSKTREIPFTHL